MSPDEDLQDGAGSTASPPDGAPSTQGEPPALAESNGDVDSAAEPAEPSVSDVEVSELMASEASSNAASFRYDEKFYEPISPDSPTGAALEFYHFAEMDQELAWPTNDFGRPDAAKRPNFRAVKEAALSFLNGTKELKATRDVRPMLALAIAEAGDKGPVGLAKALDLFVSIATSHWEVLHPQKEDEDDDEMMTRMEEMRKYMNPATISLAVESVGIARSPRVGDLTTRTFGIAATKVKPKEGEFSPGPDALTALLSEEDAARESVIEAHGAYRHAIGQLQALAAFLEERPDLDQVDLAAVSDTLEKHASYLAPFVGGEAAEEVGEEGSGPDPVAEGVAAPSAPIAGAKTLPEAMGLIDDILVFYARSGRSSPVPLGLIALRDLMAGDFNTWISQTAASGLSEAAINLSAVDASRLSSFASGDIPAAAAPAAIEFDFNDIDTAIYDAETAFSTIDNAVYQHQMTLPPDEGEETNSVLAPEVLAMREALDKVQAARVAMDNLQQASSGESSTSENALRGDEHHSRITDRSGVKQSLDAVAAYFEREEPSSPAPAYLRRLRSLVDARFAEIAQELMPEDGGEAKLRLEPKTNLR